MQKAAVLILFIAIGIIGFFFGRANYPESVRYYEERVTQLETAFNKCRAELINSYIELEATYVKLNTANSEVKSFRILYGDALRDLTNKVGECQEAYNIINQRDSIIQELNQKLDMCLHGAENEVPELEEKDVPKFKEKEIK